MIEKLKIKFISELKNQNIYGEYYPVSLNEKRRLPLRILFKYIVYGLLLMSFAGAFLYDKAPFITGLLFVGYIFFIVKTFYTRIKRRFFFSGKPFEATLRNFIYKNKLYTEFSNGELESEIELGYIEDLNTLTVIVIKDGGKYQEMSDKLSERLESALNISFYKKVVEPNYCEYIFRKQKVERKVISEMPLTDETMKISIYDDLEIDLHKLYSGIISGASGSGKSYLTYYLIANFASKFTHRKIGDSFHEVNSKLYVIDPKESDLLKHMQMANMPENQYGSTVSDAFRILKEVTAEMKKRQAIYKDSTAFDSTMLDLNFEPILLVVDEYPSLVALMDKKQRTDFDNLVGNFARLSRQLSLGIWVIAQQANSESIPTAIREQLSGFRIFMGAPSQQSAQMMFSTSAKELPMVNQVGEGIISIDGQEPISFLSGKFVRDVNEVIQPVLQSAAINYKEIYQIEELEKTKENAEEIGNTPEEIAFLKEHGKTYENWESNFSIDSKTN